MPMPGDDRGERNVPSRPERLLIAARITQPLPPVIEVDGDPRSDQSPGRPPQRLAHKPGQCGDPLSRADVMNNPDGVALTPMNRLAR
jgi:hypothetical protein